MKIKLLTAILFNILLFSQVAYPQSADKIASNLNEYMNRIDSLGFSGALLVAKDSEIIFSKGFGLADRARGIPVTPETIFTTGSITKQFTAAAILTLEMQGNLSVKDPITKYFKNVPEDKTGITLHHLLTHSAGFKPALGYDFAEISRDEYVELAFKTPLNRSPGELYEYSNTGYSLLAAIVEQVSGQSYDTFLQNHLFKPAGMSNTGYPKSDWNRDKLAHGYKGEQDWGVFLDHPMADDGPYWHLRGNGGIHSTIEDMYKWHLALENNAILSAEAKKKYYTPHIAEGPRAQSFYGYGWSIVETPHGKLITHNGGNPYFTADFLRYVDENVVIYIVSNSAEQRATRISRTIARIALGEEYSLLPLKIEKISAADLGQTEMGQHALAFLQMLASDDETTTLRLIKEHFGSKLLEKNTADKYVKALQPDQEKIGEAEIGQIVKSGAHALELTVQSKNAGEWWLLNLEFEVQPPHGIIGIGITDTPPPAASTATVSAAKKSDSVQANKDWGLPDSPTGRRSSAFLEAVRRTDESLTKQFIEEQFTSEFINAFSMDEHLQMFNRMYSDMEALELLGADKTGPYSAELSVRSKKTGNQFRVIIKLAPKSPNKIASLGVEAQ